MDGVFARRSSIAVVDKGSTWDQNDARPEFQTREHINASEISAGESKELYEKLGG